jgi:hypothetical protein
MQLDMDLYNTQIEIGLAPHGSKIPKVQCLLNNQKISTISLSHCTKLFFDLSLEKKKHKLIIDFYNKSENDADTAVEIKYVRIENFTLNSFLWNNRYYPRYPKHLLQQKDLPEFYQSSTYMGWNGIWVFEFEVPIFTWVHKLENVGWIFD